MRLHLEEGMREVGRAISHCGLQTEEFPQDAVGYTFTLI